MTWKATGTLPRKGACTLSYWQTKTHCCGNIVAHDVSLRAQIGKHLLRTQNVSEQNQKHFCVPDTKFVSATNVARAGKRGNICVGNNVSATMCPRLPVPLNIYKIMCKLFNGPNNVFFVQEYKKRLFEAEKGSIWNACHVSYQNSHLPAMAINLCARKR